MAVTQEQRKTALDLLLPYQRSDFEGIFRAMDGTQCSLHTLLFEQMYKYTSLGLQLEYRIISFISLTVHFIIISMV